MHSHVHATTALPPQPNRGSSEGNTIALADIWLRPLLYPSASNPVLARAPLIGDASVTAVVLRSLLKVWRFCLHSLSINRLPMVCLFLLSCSMMQSIRATRCYWLLPTLSRRSMFNLLPSTLCSVVSPSVPPNNIPPAFVAESVCTGSYDVLNLVL